MPPFPGAVAMAAIGSFEREFMMYKRVMRVGLPQGANSVSPSSNKGVNMPYMIDSFDKPRTGELRQQLQSAHLDYLEQYTKLLHACVATLLDDDATGTLRFFIVVV